MKQIRRPSLAVAVLIFTPDGVPLVMDESKPTPHYWKLPGGKAESKDPERVAVEKVKKETGIPVCENALKELYREDRGTHTFVLLMTHSIYKRQLRNVGRDGELVKFFKVEHILQLNNFFPPHRRLVVSELKRHYAEQ